jgi:hypothetical protein
MLSAKCLRTEREENSTAQRIRDAKTRMREEKAINNDGNEYQLGEQRLEIEQRKNDSEYKRRGRGGVLR